MADEWLPVRADDGKLIAEYNPATNEIRTTIQRYDQRLRRRIVEERRAPLPVQTPPAPQVDKTMAAVV
jgi:hypothetical protein